MGIIFYIKLANLIKLANKYNLCVKGVYPCVGYLHYNVTNTDALDELLNPVAVWLFYNNTYLAWFNVDEKGVKYTTRYLELLRRTEPLEGVDFLAFVKELEEYNG